MNLDQEEIAKTFELLKIPKNHATVGFSSMLVASKQYRSLFVNRRLGDAGWSDVQIQTFMFLLSTLDTNNKAVASGDDSVESRWCGVGEREGRVYSSLVAHRHYGLSHGMGRSGDITEPQPKAVGSSVLVKLTLLLVLDIVRRGSGLNAKGPAAHGILLPLCTGMSMALVLSHIRESEEDKSKTVVLWSRIDQKSCFKAIQSAGLTCVVVETKLEGDAVVTDMEAMEAAMKKYEGKVLAVITTTSCFAPRVPDKVDKVATLCKESNVSHIINNAYGLQCEATSKLINRACVVGRVDAIVSSTDKNFLVPVGGALVLSPEKKLVAGVGKIYAGRASSSPIVDLFITLLSMGMNGYKGILAERQEKLKTFSSRLGELASKHGERLLQCQSNTISFGITLDNLAQPREVDQDEDQDEKEYLQSVSKDISAFGSMLFSRCVSGTRVVPRAQTKKIGDYEFVGFGSSVVGYPHAYMTAACAVGLTRDELEEFYVRLDKTFQEKKKGLKK